MDSFQYMWPMLAVGLPLVLVNLAWYVAVIVLLFKIWGKVRHLPG